LIDMKKLVISMLLTGLVFCSFAAFAEPAPKIGYPTPILELANLEGKTVNLKNYAEAKPLILVFFASWSKSCQTEMADLQELHANSKGNLKVLAVSFDKKIKNLSNYITKNSILFPILIDKKLSSLDKFQILILPTTFCINRHGIIEKIFVDYDDNVKKALIEWQKS